MISLTRQIVKLFPRRNTRCSRCPRDQVWQLSEMPTLSKRQIDITYPESLEYRRFVDVFTPGLVRD